MPTQATKVIVIFVHERRIHRLITGVVWNTIMSSAQLLHFVQFACNIAYLAYAIRVEPVGTRRLTDVIP